MNLELRNISRNERLSEETNCYSAVLYLDGKPIADVGNHGHGGPDEARARPGCRDTLAAVEAYFEALPEIETEFMIDGKPMMLKQSLEMWCETQVTNSLILKDMRRALKNKVLLAEGGKIMQYSWKGLKEVTPRHIDSIREKHKNATILNGLPEPQALALYKGAAA
jgi:hypothetical protein